MIAVADLEFIVEEAEVVASEYVKEKFGANYSIKKCTDHEDYWSFMVIFHQDDIKRDPMIGYISVFHNGLVELLSNDKIRDMKEMGEVQAAKARGQKFARDEDGFVLRCQARIKASCWTSDNIGMKFGAEEGIFIDSDKPVWRFSVHYYFADGESPTLDVIDVDAKTGHVHPLSKNQIEEIVGGMRAAQRVREHTAEAVQ